VLREHRGSGHEPEVPAEAQQEEREQEHAAAVGRGDGGHHARDRQDRGAEIDRGAGAEPLSEPAGHRREGEHPQGVAREDQAHGREIVAVGGHVERGHRHDQGHHELAGDQGDDRGRHAGAAQDGPNWPHGHRRGVLVGQVVIVGQLVRVGAKEGERRDGRDAHEHHRHEIGPGEHRQADGHRARTGDGHQPRAHDGAHGRRPDHEADGRGPLRGRHHVRGGIARQLVGRVAEADEHRPQQEEREGAGDDGSRCHEGPDHAHDVAQGQPDAPAAARHE